MTSEDPIQQAFEQMRAEAKKRVGYVPDLNKQVERRRLEKPTKPKMRGIPTGRDGRRLARRDQTVSLSSVLNQEIKARGWQREIAGGWVNSHWAELVGPNIAQHTKVEMLKDKKLFITCDSTAWATNLRMMQRQILQQIAAHVGPDIIAELRIFGPQAPSWRKGPLHVKGRGPRDTYG
ncbi:DciA family protein [Corynebacterium epidermidicanis]|uniref:Putative RNA-binding protein containing Zn ribbon n=1 Tax=Corynebacterium epidermidicanis TaxID=1050174 RepID=A0A0G3GSS4_9CORY|nr:DciA family protein [Corynebacterium epidermidicanis]AKK01902.1 putative RNA-binding protein containing Zn ribbon [Corynebacterium epidermidicanis]